MWGGNVQDETIYHTFSPPIPYSPQRQDQNQLLHNLLPAATNQ
jgi:hypothetical protein